MLGCLLEGIGGGRVNPRRPAEADTIHPYIPLLAPGPTPDCGTSHYDLDDHQFSPEARKPSNKHPPLRLQILSYT